MTDHKAQTPTPLDVDEIEAAYKERTSDAKIRPVSHVSADVHDHVGLLLAEVRRLRQPPTAMLGALEFLFGVIHDALEAGQIEFTPDGTEKLTQAREAYRTALNQGTKTPRQSPTQGADDFALQLKGQLDNVANGNASAAETVAYVIDLIGQTNFASMDAALKETIRKLRLELGHAQYLLSTANAQIKAARRQPPTQGGDDDRLTQQEHSCLAVCGDWIAPFEIAKLLYQNGAHAEQQAAVLEAMQSLRDKYLVRFGSQNGTYKRTDRGTSVLQLAQRPVVDDAAVEEAHNVYYTTLMNNGGVSLDNKMAAMRAALEAAALATQSPDALTAKYRALVRELDLLHGTPCEQIRHAQEIDALRGKVIEEAGWVIERGDSEVSRPFYWGGSSGWTYDNLCAVRFSRKEDAESVDVTLQWERERRHQTKIANRIAEHGWS